MKRLLWLFIFGAGFFASESPFVHAAGESPLAADIDQRAKQAESKVIAWRRDIHQNPELNRTTRDWHSA